MKIIDNSEHDLSEDKIKSKLFIPKRMFSGRKHKMTVAQMFWGLLIGIAALFGVAFSWAYIPTSSPIGLLVGIGSLIFMILSCETVIINKIIFFVVMMLISLNTGRNIALIGGVLFVSGILVRKLMYREGKEIDRYMNFLETQVTDLMPFWNIVNIGEDSDVKSAGRITYDTGVEAYVIEVQREYALGRPKGFKARHYTAVTDAITYLLQEGYSYVYYSYNIGTPNVEPLADTVSVLGKFPESPIYRLASAIIQYVRKLVGSVPVEMEYYLVYTNGSTDQARRLRQDMDITVDTFKGSLYGKARILDKTGCIRFFLGYFGINYIDEKSLYRKFGKDSDLEVISNVKRNEAGDVIDVENEFGLYEGTEEYDNLIRGLYKARGYEENEEDK